MSFNVRNTAIHGQLTLPNTLANALGAAVELINGVAIKARASNTGSVYVGVAGVTTTTGYELAPGDTLTLPIDNISSVFIIGAASDRVSYIGN